MRSARSSTARHEPSSNRSRPSSISMPIISSTNSGFPSAAARIRSRAVPGRSASPSRLSSSAPASSPASGSSRIEVAFIFPPLQPGRISSSSGRGDADEQQFCVARPIRQVLDQIQQERLRPVDVVEHHDERPLSSQMLEQLAHAPRRRPRASRPPPSRTSRRRARDAVAVVGVLAATARERGERRCGVVGLALPVACRTISTER